MTVIRDLAPEELGWLAEREREIFGAGAWSPSLIAEDFEHGHSRYRVAEHGGERVAYAVYGFEGDAFHLMNLAVVPSRRREGFAHALLADALREAEEVGADEVWLEVAVDNAPALALYREHGFEDVRVRPKYYQPGGIDALVMRKPLRPYTPGSASRHESLE